MGSFGPNFSTNPGLLNGIIGKRNNLGIPSMSSIPQFGGRGEPPAGSLPPTPETVEAKPEPPIDQGDVPESRWDKYKALLPAVGGLVAGAIAPNSDMVSGFLQSQIGTLDQERKRRQEREDRTHKLSLEVLNRQYSEETLKKHPELAEAKKKAAQMVVQGKPLPSKIYSDLVLNDALAAADEKKYLDEKKLSDRKAVFDQERKLQTDAELEDYRLAQEVAQNPEKYPEGSPEWYRAQGILAKFQRGQMYETVDPRTGRPIWGTSKEVLRQGEVDKKLDRASEEKKLDRASQERRTAMLATAANSRTAKSLEGRQREAALRAYSGYLTTTLGLNDRKNPVVPFDQWIQRQGLQGQLPPTPDQRPKPQPATPSRPAGGANLPPGFSLE